MRVPVLLLIMILMVTLSLSALHVLQVNMPCLSETRNKSSQVEITFFFFFFLTSGSTRT